MISTLFEVAEVIKDNFNGNVVEFNAKEKNKVLYFIFAFDDGEKIMVKLERE